MRLTTDPEWSSEQLAIFDWFAAGEGSLVVRARAGTGKTTTIIAGIAHAPARERKLLAAFGKRDAVELQRRLRDRSADAEALTIHALGRSIVRMFWDGVGMESKKGERARDLAQRAIVDLDLPVPDAIVRLVARLHTFGRETAPLAGSWQDLEPIAWERDCVPDRDWEDYGWGLEQVLRAAHGAMLLARERPRTTGIDFTDMIYLPVANHWVRPRYDLVVIDEYQDMNACQHAIAVGIARDRLCVVGDERQAIYKFRGADSTMAERIRLELGATELGLTTTYRCARLIVEEARQVVPDYRSAPGSPDGVVRRLPTHQLLEEVAVGDAVLSRTNAPLLGLCLRAMRNGIPARVEGRDEAVAGLRALIRRLGVGSAAHSMSTFLQRLATWERDQVERARASGADDDHVGERVEAIREKAESLRAISDGAAGVREIEARLDEMFRDLDAGRCVVFSTVHRAKGREWRRVFVLWDSLREGDEEERNIRYVATTRAIRELVKVGGASRSGSRKRSGSA